jgi:hypothetical protein
LLKKGVGCGSHQSDVICSTVGWLKEAGQQLEYGKNYDGYWMGKLFMKQVRKFSDSELVASITDKLSAERKNNSCI